jgi:AcrR family transcriptional regulator
MSPSGLPACGDAATAAGRGTSRTITARRKSTMGLSSDADEARQQILVAADRVIQRYGVSKTTMDDIGKEAGICRPTIYRYFADRDTLMGALIERRSRMLFERARRWTGYRSYSQ